MSASRNGGERGRDSSLRHRGAVRNASYLAALLVAACWIAICAAAPEVLWQGLRDSFHHLAPADLLSALVTGMILAFFVDPGMERLRAWLGQSGGAPVEGKESHALFTAIVGLAFALVAVCVHDAIATFVLGHGSREDNRNASVRAAIELAAAWAFVPFVITLAWGSRTRGALEIPVLLLGLASPALAGWIFGWPWQEVAVTVVPTATILLVGRRRTFARRAGLVALCAAISVPAVFALCAILHAVGATSLRLYTTAQFWVDCRFYLGWSIGLALAPFPSDERTAPSVPDAL
jgi:hypothetical protein